VTRILADTGFLIALFHPADRLAPFARSYLRKHRHPLATVAPVIVETCFFQSSAEKAELLDWAQRGGIAVVEAPVESYPESPPSPRATPTATSTLRMRRSSGSPTRAGVSP
jgi:hypothetical protein